MKQTLKKIIPKPVLRRVVVLRDRIDLNLAAERVFEEKPLSCALTRGNLAALFTDSRMESLWESARQKIAAVYGDNAKMGGVNPGDRRALYYMIAGLKPENVLEIGTHIGASTVFMAEALQSASPQARMTTVDIVDVNAPGGPWREGGLSMPPRRCLEDMNLSGRVTFRIARSSDFLKTATEKYDFIFLDGDHASRTVYEEVALALKILNPGGVIVLHDYYPLARPLFGDGMVIAGPYLALERIMRENPALGVVPLGNLPWPTKQGVHATSLAVLTQTKDNGLA